MAGESREVPTNSAPEKSSQREPESYQVSPRAQSKLQEVLQWFKNRGWDKSSREESVNQVLQSHDLPDKKPLMPEPKSDLSRLRPGHIDWAGSSKPREGGRPFDMSDVAEMQRRGMTPEEYGRQVGQSQKTTGDNPDNKPTK